MLEVKEHSVLRLPEILVLASFFRTSVTLPLKHILLHRPNASDKLQELSLKTLLLANPLHLPSPMAAPSLSSCLARADRDLIKSIRSKNAEEKVSHS